LIPEEIEDCRNYIRLKFPGFFTDSWLTKEERIAKKREVRDAMVAVGYEPKLVQIAMRDPHYFYIEKEHVYPPGTSMSNPNHGWKTYTVVEKYRDQYGWWRRSVVWGEDTEAEAYKLRCEGHFVGTEAEVFAILGPVKGESPCGHLKGACACEDGLIVNKMYEISRKKKPPLQARYMRWRNQKHEFKSDNGEWASVHTKDVKERVKGEFAPIAPIAPIDQVATTGSKHPPVVEERDGETFATCDVCGEMVQITGGLRHGGQERYSQHKNAATGYKCFESGKPVLESLSRLISIFIRNKERKTWTFDQVWSWLKEKHPDVYALYEAEGFPRWIPLPKNLRPQGWHAMRPKPSAEIREKIKAGCEYCAVHHSSRSCPIHGWAETRDDQYAHHNVRADGHRTDQRYCARCHCKPCAIR